MERDLGKPQGRRVGGVDTDVVSEPNRSAWFHAFQRIEGGIEGACRGVQIDLQLHPGAFRTALDVAVADLVRGIQAGHLTASDNGPRHCFQGFGIAGYMGRNVRAGPSSQATGGLPLLIRQAHGGPEKSLGGLPFGSADFG